MNADIPKQYLKLGGKAVLRHAIETFLSIPKCASLHVIINSDDADLYHDAVNGLPVGDFIEGNKERNLSVYNGLKKLSHLKNEDIILVHDGVRPLITLQKITYLLKAMQDNRAASLATPLNATLRRANTEDEAQEQIPREHLWAMQTPQAFRYGDLLKAHKNADTIENVTDDTNLVSALGIPVKLVQGRETNIKITLPQDLHMAEQLLKSQMHTRSGSGFDVHAFDAESKGPVRLCGIDIDHDHKLKGHSDADVALHAITDALLGAIGEGDIGQHFPPSDNTYKNMDSAIFLEKALQMAQSKGASINNIDLTIICEAPKIGSHVSAMKTRLSEIMNLRVSAMNVKATTTEQLGFTGRKEGIAAQALVTVSMPSDE